MTTRRKLATAAALGVAALAVGGGAAFASGSLDGRGDSDGTVSGRGADRATDAALVATDGGRANSVELDSENGATWEVEVTKPSGDTVDVRLDEHFRVVVIEGDSEDGRS